MLFAFAARTAAFLVGLRAFFPSNMLLQWLRTRRGLPWGVPAMLLAVPYYLLGRWLFDLIQAGTAPQWLLLVVCACGLSALKFVLFGPWSLVLLIRSRTPS